MQPKWSNIVQYRSHEGFCRWERLVMSLERRSVVQQLLADRGDLLVVAGLGASAWDVAAVGDNPLDFPLWGGMGGAVMMGLGLALAQPTRRVLVLTGDGELLMG